MSIHEEKILIQKAKNVEDLLPPVDPNQIKYYNTKQVNSPQYTDSDNSEDEGLSDYKVNGYHPVHIGEVLLERYIIMQKLGYGHFSTAWLALDTKFGNYVAIKIQKAAQQYIDAAYDEVEILQELAKHNFDKEWIKSLKEYYKDDSEKLADIETTENSKVVQLLNSFIYHGQNGRHFCMVFEIVGVTLLELIKRYNYKGIPLPYIRIITKQILIGLDFLHRMCHIIHTDLKPENVLVCLTKEELREIQSSGHLNIQKTDKKKKTKTKNIDEPKEIVEEKNTMSGKQLRKKRQKFRKKQIKKMEKMGMSPQEIEKKMREIMKQKNGPIQEKDEENIDVDNFDIEELIERPRVSSVPKINLNNQKEEDNYLGNGALLYDINLMEYRKNLQRYSKEKNRILHDEEYRRNMIEKSNILTSEVSDQEKSKMMKKLNEKMSRRGPEIDPSIEVKICDIGNACWFNHHFSTIIQTRQYRSPEVILGINYNETSDIWSLACMLFELATGDFLFEPRKGDTFSKNDDHLAQIIEAVGKMPKNFALSGLDSFKYFDKRGKLRRIKNLIYFPIKDILVKKYNFKEKEAKAFSDFLMPMLEYYPDKRASARELLKHPWLNMPPDFDYKISEIEIEKKKMIESNLIKDENEEKKKDNEEKDIYESDSELFGADDEDNNLSDKKAEKEFEEDDSGDDNPDKVLIPNFNNSFSEYGQFVDLTSLDRANPQFDKIMKHK
jgi:serine/threonine protein kinase